jgi:hypothetical protein
MLFSCDPPLSAPPAEDRYSVTRLGDILPLGEKTLSQTYQNKDCLLMPFCQIFKNKQLLAKKFLDKSSKIWLFYVVDFPNPF